VWFVPAGTAEQWRADLGLSYAQVGAVLGAAAPGALLLGSLATVAADSFSRRVLASAGAAVFAVAMAAFALGATFPVLLAASFLAGAAATSMADACEVALVDVAGHALRPALARANLLGVAGDVAGPVLLVVTTAAGWSWRVPFAVLAATLAAYGLWLATLPFPEPAGRDHDHCDDLGVVQPPGLRAVVCDRRVWSLGIVSLLTSPLDEPYLGFVVAYLVAVRDLPATGALLVATVAVAGGAVAYTAGTRVMHHRTDTEVAVAGIALSASAAAGIVVAPHVVLVGTSGFAFGVGLNLTWLGVQHRMLTLRPGEAGRTKAVVSAVEMCGLAIPIVIGALSDALGLRAGLAAYAVLPLLALPFLPRARQPGVRAEQQ
jgi:FSR family fosmidomycin resistance protein-like MFS transporter